MAFAAALAGAQPAAPPRPFVARKLSVPSGLVGAAWDVRDPERCVPPEVADRPVRVDGCSIDADEFDAALPGHADQDLIYQLRFRVRVHHTFTGAVIAGAPHKPGLEHMQVVLDGLRTEAATGEHDVHDVRPVLPVALSAAGVVEKPGKIRRITDLSFPRWCSVNGHVALERYPRMRMPSTNQVCDAAGTLLDARRHVAEQHPELVDELQVLAIGTDLASYYNSFFVCRRDRRLQGCYAVAEDGTPRFMLQKPVGFGGRWSPNIGQRAASLLVEAARADMAAWERDVAAEACLNSWVS